MTAVGAHHPRYVTPLLHDTGPDLHYRALMPVGETAIQRLAHLIREAREDLGWTQPDLARESGVSRPTIQRYETAKSGSPDPDHVRALFDALDIPRREIAVVLGFLTPEEAGVPAEPARPSYSATTAEVIELLEDPGVSDAEKRALAALLRASQAGRAAQAAPGRRVG